MDQFGSQGALGRTWEGLAGVLGLSWSVLAKSWRGLGEFLGGLGGFGGGLDGRGRGLRGSWADRSPLGAYSSGAPKAFFFSEGPRHGNVPLELSLKVDPFGRQLIDSSGTPKALLFSFGATKHSQNGSKNDQQFDQNSDHVFN